MRGRPAVRGKGTYGGRPRQRVEEQGTWASQKHSEAGYGRPVDRGVWTAKTVKRPPQQPARPPIRQLLGAADAQTAHPATSNTAPAHQLLGSANAETTPAGAPAGAADRKQRPDAACEGTNGCPGPRKGATTRRNVTRGVSPSTLRPQTCPEAQAEVWGERSGIGSRYHCCPVTRDRGGAVPCGLQRLPKRRGEGAPSLCHRERNGCRIG